MVTVATTKKKKKKIHKQQMLERMRRKGNPPALLGGMWIGTAPVQKSMLLLLSHFSRIRLYVNPRDGSPPGSWVPGILQARTLEWVAISFSNGWKWKVKGKSLSLVQPSVNPWTAAFQAPLSMGFSRQEYWSRMPLPSPVWMFLKKIKVKIELSFDPASPLQGTDSEKTIIQKMHAAIYS